MTGYAEVVPNGLSAHESPGPTAWFAMSA